MLFTCTLLYCTCMLQGRHNIKPGRDCRNYICGWSSDVADPCWDSQFCSSHHLSQDLRSGKTFPWITTKYARTNSILTKMFNFVIIHGIIFTEKLQLLRQCTIGQFGFYFRRYLHDSLVTSRKGTCQNSFFFFFFFFQCWHWLNPEQYRSQAILIKIFLA